MTNKDAKALRALEQKADAMLRKHGNNLAWQRGPGCDTWDAAIRAIVEALSALPTPEPVAGEPLSDPHKLADEYAGSVTFSGEIVSAYVPREISERILAHLRAPLENWVPDAQLLATEGFTALEAWCELVEYDDRTSPEEYPDMALITFEELRMFMSRANFTGCTCGEIAGEDAGCIVHSTSPPATLASGLQ